MVLESCIRALVSLESSGLSLSNISLYKGKEHAVWKLAFVAYIYGISQFALKCTICTTSAVWKLKSLVVIWALPRLSKRLDLFYDAVVYPRIGKMYCYFSFRCDLKGVDCH